MSNKIGIHVYVSGRVQGVWYRASTEAQAVKLGVMGFAKNLDDGRVEVLAFGERERVMQLLEWLKHGPELAKVTELNYQEVAWEDYPKFETR